MPLAVPGLIALVIFFQLFLSGLHNQTFSKAPAHLIASEEVRDLGVGELAVVSKLLIKGLHFADTLPDGPRPPPAKGEATIRADLDEDETEMMAFLDKAAVSRTDRLRVALVAGEVEGAQAAIERLAALGREVDSEGDLAKDIFWLRLHYASAFNGVPNPIPAESAAALIGRHGWFAELALSYGKSGKAAPRARVVGGMTSLVKFQVFIGLALAMAFVIGIVLTVVMARKAHYGEFELRVENSGVPAFIYLETFGVFLLLFSTALMGGVLLLGQTGAWAAAVSECLTWACAGSLLWPLIRGVSWHELCTDLGLHAGDGVGTEIIIGIGAFLISSPLTAIVGIFAGIIEQAILGSPPDPEGVPMFNAPLSDSWAAVVLGAASSVVWAPLVEESLFRGALHRWLPGWLRIGGRVAVSAVVFGLVHPYSPAGMASVATAGVVFGLLREWRGSLVGPITAHMLHNATIEMVTIGTLLLID